MAVLGAGRIRLGPGKALGLQVKLQPDPAAPKAQAAEPERCHPVRVDSRKVNLGTESYAYRPGSGVTAPVLRYKVEAEYTAEARNAGCEGAVEVALVVAADGTSQNLDVLSSLDAGLDQKAIEAVRQYKWAPGIKDGQAVPVATKVSVDFRLPKK